MHPEPQEIPCPHNPDHGIAVKRWLPALERESITGADDQDVFEVSCPVCGCREYLGDPTLDQAVE